MMWETLGPRQKKIAELLLEGRDNADIARELHIKPRTVKAHFNRMFLNFQIRDGIKRVKLAVMLYREQNSAN